MTILIIEDDINIREILHYLLELNGHTVTAVGDGPAGIAQAQNSPDLILCDIGLPGLDGYEVITAIRKLPQCSEIPFIFLTARAERSDQRRGMALGADDYITKPFTEKELIDAIEARLRRLIPMREKIDQLTNERHAEIGANWSHELLTPLNSVMGGLDLIEQDVETISRDELKELLQLIRDGANRQHDLSQQLVLYFELQRIKETPSSYAGHTCSVDKAVEAGAAHAAEAEHRTNDLTVSCAPAEVRLNEAHLTAAIAAVVSNAFRFSKPGQQVTIRGLQNADRYIVDIVDKGIGMTAEQLNSIGSFKQFGRNKMEQQGLGLGLTIARFVAEIGGGQFALQAGPNRVGLQARFDLLVV